MANQALLARKEQFEREVAAYSGEDPLKPWYEYLSWLDAQFGKDKILDTFTSTLESALNAHWNVQKYKDDARLIELQMIYASLQGDPLKLYKSYYDRGIATQSAILYINWANHFAAAGEYRRADEIFKLGCEKTSPDLKHDLSSAFEKFLATVGRRFLDGEIKDNSCTKCGTPPETVVKEILMNPGPPGNWDDFTTLVAVFEEPNPKNVPMYPKNKVYREAGKEYSLEELLAEEYFAKERQKNEKGTMQQPLLVTTPKSSGSNMGVPLGAEAAMRSSCFPEPLLPKSKEESISTQSFTSRTKMAMNFIQEMWSSPSPCVDPPRVENRENRPSMLPRTEEKARTPFPIYVDENPETPKAAERKPLTPFNVFNDNDNEDVGDPPPTHIGTRASTAKKTLTQPKPNVLSERKVPSTKLAEPPKPHAKQHLFEQPLFDFQNANDVLATKLSEASVSDPPTPFQPFGGIQPLFPAEQVVNDDETTCNTRAFNFALPSSTPLQQKKSLAPYHRIEQNQGNVLEEQPTYHTQQNLSVILEASKERCSSSGSCASQPRTPGIPGSSVPKQLMLEEGTEIDPFCPKIIDKLLKLINFPLPHHIEGYHSQNQALPSITKTLRLGNETFTTSGELGRGAYARVVKATNDKSTVALKVEKPACRWEYYIAKEIQRRVDPNVRLLFMDIRSAHIYNNGSILVTDWAKHGSLLNVINSYKQKTGVALEQNLAAHFALEVMRAVEHLHKAKIIHGDIKPDNFVIRCLPSSNEPGPSLMLIDFGRSIDMSLYPAGTKFHKVVTTDGFQCGEMREQKPWTYQTDLFGLAVTIFCLLAGDYMKVARKNGEWKPLKPLPRFLRREIWDPILHDLINVQSCEKLPNLSEHCKTVESWFNNDCNRYDKYAAYRHLCNILAGK